MTDRKTDVEGAIRSFLKRSKKRNTGIQLDTSLYSEGLGLDSLETAELSAVLEDELGNDPFTNGEMPETVGDIVEFYDKQQQRS
jgi:acyl carrier protein